jgi:hypothetical protein
MMVINKEEFDEKVVKPRHGIASVNIHKRI